MAINYIDYTELITLVTLRMNTYPGCVEHHGTWGFSHSSPDIVLLLSITPEDLFRNKGSHKMKKMCVSRTTKVSSPGF